MTSCLDLTARPSEKELEANATAEAAEHGFTDVFLHVYLHRRYLVSYGHLHHDYCRALARIAELEKSIECRGHERGGLAECCARAGEYNGFGSDGPLAFRCPKGCSCHD